MAIRDHRWLNRFRLSICSNGTLYFDERVRNYIAKNAHHLSFSISIDGNKKLHDSCRIFPDGSGSYDVAMAAVKDYLENFGASMGSKMTIAPGNVNYVAEAVESLIENGYTNINLNCVYEEGWDADYAKILYAQLKELADYIFENGLQNDIFLSIFDDNFFHPMDENDNQNWCWAKGTPVLTTKGYKPIEEIKIGDEVYTEDGTIHPVINTMSHMADNVVNINVPAIGDFTCTRNHKLFVKNHDTGVYGKAPVEEISKEDSIKFFHIEEDGLVVRPDYVDADGISWVTGLTMVDAESQDVYNITVQDNHSYIAGGLASANCGGTGAMLSVDWKGDLYPCIRYMESSLGTEVKPIIIGNVETGILATSEQKYCSDCLKCITRRSQSTDECWNCPIAAGCSWCSAYNYQCFGTADHRATFICIMHKARCLANSYYWNKRYRLNGENKRFKLYIPEDWALEIIDEKEWKFLNILSQP